MDFDLLPSRARAHLAAGNPAEAEKIARVYTREVEPKDAAGHRVYAEAALARGDFETAVMEASLAAVHQPENTSHRRLFREALNGLASHSSTQPRLQRGAGTLLNRMDREPTPRVGPAPAAARSIDLVLRMEEPAGSELNLIEIAGRLRRHVPTRIWSEIPPHPHLLELDPTIETIVPGNLPVGDTLAVMGTYTNGGPWLRRIRARRIILHFNVFSPIALLHWLGATAQLPAERVDILYPSRALRDATGIDGEVLYSPVDTAHFSPRPPVGAVGVAGRMSRDADDKHHPQDPMLYASLLRTGVGVRILGGTRLAPFLAPRSGLTLLPAYALPPATFLRGLDLFLYRTGRSFESWGRVITEAMACGLPVICHRAGGYAEIIRHGENGYLFDTTEDALGLIAALRNDAPTLARIGTAARQTVIDLFSPAAEERIVAYFVGG